MNTLKILALGGALALASTAANASLLDFTDPASYTISPANVANGSFHGVNFTLTATGGFINDAEAGPGVQGPLAGITDGLGIIDDEISNPLEFYTLVFDQEVTITAFYALDLFEPETANLSVDGAPSISFASTVPLSDGIGFNAFSGLSLTGTTFVFTAESFNEIGLPDFALAGLEIAPIPLPAGLLLLGGALGALGVARRRKAVFA